MGLEAQVNKKNQKIIIFDSCDMTGKTNVANELSKILNIPIYKNKNEHNKTHDKLISLFYGIEELTQFLEQTSYSIIFDRFHVSEYVYSKVLGRYSCEEKIFEIDKRLSKLNCFIIYPWKSSKQYKKDDSGIIDIKYYDKIKEKYEDFFKKTKCNVIKYNSDDENLNKQIKYILSKLNEYSNN